MTPKKKKSVLSEILRLLNYLQENDSIQEKLNPILIFGKEKIDNRIIKLCQEGEYIFGDHISGWKIKIKGIQFLEEYQKEKRMDETSKITMFLSAILVITTIASFFKELKTIDPILLATIYGIICILILIYFKRNEIKL